MKLRPCVLFCSIAVAGVSSAIAQTSISLAPQKMPAVGHVDERFQSYNIEMVEVTGGRFWAPYRTNAEAPANTQQQAAPAGLPPSLFRYRTPVDLGNERLRNLAAALGPAYMRVSGTWANSTYFHDSDEPAPANPPAGFNAVLTRQQWKGVIDFGHAADAELVTSFAISPGVRDSNGVWTPVEGKKVVEFTRSIGGRIAAAELFNEPTYAGIGGAPKGYDAAAYGRDFRAFRAFIEKDAPKIEVLGPGSVGEGGSLGAAPGMKLIRSEDMLREGGPGLDAFSYHFYGGVSKRCAPMGPPMGTTPDAALTEKWLMLTARDEAFYAALRDRFAPGKPIWVTETGETACGGDPWAADFIDSFRYLNQLGLLAQKGVQVVMHNTLDASDYGLLDETNFDPRPNYWAAVLWRRLMGTAVLDAGHGQAPNLYLYAHCLRGVKGGVAVLAINADKDNAREIALPKASSRYTLTAPDLMRTAVMLNGVELKAGSDGSLPAMEGRSEAAGKIELAPVSISFFTIPKANNNACR
ncbi:MAG TPA: hypothetical protein VKB38_12590 [Terracidiphilus sp.]|nr:hypothetical protein [Terracidiphilus sp.]